MADVGRLRFRRHLLVCVLAALLNELKHDLQGQTSHRSGLRPARWTRVKLASAYDIHTEPTSALDNNIGAASSSSVYQHNTDDDMSSLARLLANIHHAMPVINLNYSILSAQGRFETASNLDELIDDYYDEKFPENMTLDELQLMSIRAAVRTSPTPLHTSWGYESRQLARLGSLPVLNDDLCSQQLSHLAHRLDQALKLQATTAGSATEQADPSTGGVASPVDNFEARQVYRSGDLEIMRLMDTFGRVPSDLLRGNVRWYGSYSSCMRTRLRPTQRAGSSRGSTRHQQHHSSPNQAIKFRYCMGAYRSHGWRDSLTSGIEHERLQAAALDRSKLADYGAGTTDTNLNHYFIRIGLCLPEACDSSALERPDNSRSVERLLKFNLAKPFNSDHYKLADLYCPPDSRSPLRSIPLAGKLLLVAACLWLALVCGATLVHLNVEKFYLKTVELIRREQQQQRSNSPSMSSQSDKNEFGESDILNVKLNIIKLNIYLRDKSRQLIPGVDLVDCLSLYSNWLRYTKRVKLAVVGSHERELALEGRRLRNERLVAAGGHELGQRETGLAALTTLGRPPEGTPQTLASNGNGASKLDPMLERIRRQLGTGGGHLESAETSGQEEGPHSRRETKARPEVRVDTSSLNALKVIALVWIIAGHCIFYLGSVIANGALLKDILPTMTAFAVANGALYITELFFTITGCLTAYLTFKHTTKLARCGQPDQLELRERSPSGSSSSHQTVRLEGGPDGSANNGGESGRGEQQQQQPLVAVMEGRLFGFTFLPLTVLTRYLRILPTYLLVYASVKLISVHVGGDGQLWDYAVSANSIRRACVQESWWPVLTLTTNFVDIYKHCIVGGWYLSADMQFAIVSVPLLLLLAYGQRIRPPAASSSPSATRGAVCAGPRRHQFEQQHQQSARASAEAIAPGGKEEALQEVVLVARVQKRLFLAYGLIVGLGCVSALLSIVRTMLASRVDLSYIVKFSPHTMAMLSQNIMMYTNSIFRFRAYAAGLLLGHLLYCYEFRLIKLPKSIQQHGAKLAVVIFALGFSVMFMPVFLYRKIILSHDMTALLMVLSAAGIDLFLGSLLFLVCIGKAPKAILFALNSPLWSLLSSLSLSAFLVHTEIIIVLTSQLDPPPSIGHTLLLFVFSATLLLTYSLAFVLYLTFEMPVSRLLDSAMRNSLCMNRNRRATNN